VMACNAATFCTLMHTAVFFLVSRHNTMSTYTSQCRI